MSIKNALKSVGCNTSAEMASDILKTNKEILINKSKSAYQLDYMFVLTLILNYSL